MTIARKTAMLLATTLLLMVVAVYAASQLLVVDSYKRLEVDDARENVGRVQQALAAERAALTTLAEDWSNWNDTYAFVEDSNQEFIDANLHGQAFGKMQVDVVLFIDNDGALVNATAFDRHTKQSVDVPGEFVARFPPDSPLLRSDEKLDPVSGVISLESGPIEFVSLPILTSEYVGPSHGTIVFGRKLDLEMVSRMSKVVRLPLTVSSVKGGSLTSAEQVALTSLQAGSEAVVTPLSEDELAGYGLIEDIDGKPAAVFHVHLPRSIHAQGQQTILYLVAALVVISVIVLGMTMIALRQLVLKRVSRLSHQVTAIGVTADLQMRVTEEGNDELAGFSGVLNKTLDALLTAERKLRASEARNRALIAAIPDALAMVDNHGSIIDCKPASTGLLSHLRAPTTDTALTEVLPGDAARRVTAVAARAFESDEAQTTDFTLISEPESGSDAPPTETDFEVRVVRSGTDEALAIIRDVTARKQLEEARHNAMLLREIHHRVKNNLQVISSLLSLQSEKVDDPEVQDMFQDSRNRVKAMALIHEKLYSSRDMDSINLGEYLRDLVSFLASSYQLNNAETKIVVDFSDVDLKLEKAVSCGLIVNELVSNALKYAYPDQRPGTIRVRLASDETKELELTISDDGVGLPTDVDPHETQTLGLRLVRSLADQLDAGIEVRNGVGTAYKLTFAA